MRFIWCHALVHLLSPTDSYSDGLHIYLALVSAVLIRVGQWGGFSSDMFCTYTLSRLSSDLWVSFVLQRVFQTRCTFGENLRTPLHYWGFPFLVFFVQNFQEEVPKVVGKFSLTGNSRSSCWVFPSAWYSRQSPLLSPGFLYSPARLVLFS